MPIFSFKLGGKQNICKPDIHESDRKVCAATETNLTLHHCFTVILLDPR